MSLESLLSCDSGTLRRPTTIINQSGGKDKTYYTVTAAVPVRIQDAKAETKRRYAADNIVVTHTLFTQEGRGQVNDIWLSSAAEKMLVKGISIRRGIGDMPTFFKYDCEQLLVSSVDES